MVPKALGVSSAKELDGATVCIQTGTTTELNLADFFKVNGMSYEPVPIETNAEALQQYNAGACDAYTTDASGLAASRATFENPGDHVVLPEIISKEPLGPLVRHGDNEWGDIVRWTLNALIAAEERNRLARELHDTLAHTLSGVAVQLEAARSLSNQGNTDKAIEALDTTLEMDPGNVAALAMRAQLFTSSRRFDDARADLRHSLQIDPDSAATYALMARVEMLSGNPTGALEIARTGAAKRGAFEQLVALDAIPGVLRDVLSFNRSLFIGLVLAFRIGRAAAIRTFGLAG